MRKALLTLALVALLAVPVLGQFPGRFMGGRGGMDGTQLLANKSVQEELKLSDDQKKDIKAANDARGKAMRKAFEDMDREAFPKINEDFTKAVKKVKDKLTSDQSKRLQEIEIQVAVKGKQVRVFANAEVQKILKFTDKQKSTVKSTLSDLEKDVKELMSEAQGDRQKMGAAFKKMAEMNGEAFATVSKSLSDDQKKTLKDAQGKDFTIKMENPFGRGGRGGRGKGKDKKDDF
jgi:hypothetical protein